MNEKTLYLTDLDGTLLDRQSRLSDFTVRTLNALVRGGLVFSVATARSWYSACKVVGALALRHPLVLYNGCCLFDVHRKEALASQTFSDEEKRVLARCFASFRLSPMVYARQGNSETVSYLPAMQNEGVRRYLHQRPGDPRFRPVDAGDEARLYAGETFYFSCIGAREELYPLKAALETDARFQLLFHRELYSEDYWLEILPVGATKAAGARRLSDLLGCTKTVCFGDEVNDLALFAACDEAYAVANAVDEVKQAATAVLPFSNDEDAVARFLLEREGARLRL